MPVCLLLIALASLPVNAQEYRARLQGIITDSTQAAVQGVRITLRNANTGIETYRTTNDIGFYLFDFVEPGAYSVTAELPGFSKTVQENIVVQTRGDVTVNLTLKVGALLETVTVTTAPAAVEFNTSTMALTVERKMITDIPLIGRNPFSLALLDPAVVSRWGNLTSATVYNTLSTSSLDVGGSTTTRNDTQLDGSPIQLGRKGSWAPPMDAVQEVTVQQNAVDAEFGHSAGGVLTLSMKSGTNDVHGVVSYFGRNPALNAVTNSVVRSPNRVRNNIVGGVLGHPILKNKLFGFIAYELMRNNDPLSTQITLPTELERGGDFSRSLSTAGAMRIIYDPWSTKFDAAAGKVTRTPFPNNRISPDRMDPTSLRILKDIWLPNGPGDNISGVNNFRAAYTQDLAHATIGQRTDWNINDRWKLFGRYGRFRTPLTTSDFSPNKSRAMARGDDGVTYSRNIAADTVYTLNPTTVLNFRFSFVTLHSYFDAPPMKVGEAGLAEFWPNNPWYKGYLNELPAIYYPGITVSGIGSASFSRTAGAWYQYPETYNYSGRVSKALGKHYMKAGYESRLVRGHAMSPNLMNFRFTPDLTANTFLSPDTRQSGDAWATFLLGALDGTSNARSVPMQRPRINYYALYFQNDFKANRRLTLNLGLRWEYEPGPYDPEDRLSRYVDLNSPIPEMQASPPPIPSDVFRLRGAPYKFNGAWVFTDRQNRNMWKSRKTSLAPRLGLAFRVNDRTALRLGYARYITPTLSSTDILGSMPYPGFNAQTNVAPSIEGLPGAKLGDPFPSSANPLILPIGKGYGRYTNLGGDAQWGEYHLKTGVNDRINLSVQRQFPAQIHADITYFMNFGHDLPYTKDLNLMDPQLYYTHKSILDQRIANPFYLYLTPEKFPGQLRNLATVTRGSLLNTYPQYLTLRQINTAGVLNRYQALQIRVQGAFARGYRFLVGYNYNRERSYEFFNSDDEHAGRFSFIGSNNPRHRLSAAGAYDLPFGKGRAHLGHAHPIVNGILGGWSVSGVLFLNSGSFLRFGAMVATGDPVISNPSRARWFDTSKFSRLPAYTPRTNPWQYDGLTGPRSWNFDGALSKFFPITEAIRLEFRMEAYNALNCFIPNNPNVTVTSATFGATTSQGNRGREMQYAMRIYFWCPHFICRLPSVSDSCLSSTPLRATR